MKRVRFRDPAGSVRTGEWTGGGIEAATGRYAPDEVEVLPPTEPTKVVGVGLNYEGRFEGSDEDPPARPRTWLKGGPEVVAGHGDTVTIPDTGEVVYEAELGVVIGEQARNVPAEDAMDVVAGFTCVNDLSDMAHSDYQTMIRAKTFDNAAPMGPVLADPDEVPTQPRARLWVNGELQQDSGDDEFVHGVPAVIEDITARITLEPGDVVMMGNPGDFEPLADGDRVEIEIEGIGRLEHGIEVA